MKFYHPLAPVLVGVSIVLVSQVAIALSRDQVDQTAEKITVLIDNQFDSGSGVIIKRDGNTYTVLTTAHVVEKANIKYEIVTPDHIHYRLDHKTVKPMPEGIDLAVLQFTSNKDYSVAKIGNSDTAQRRTIAYVAGFPRQTVEIKSSIYELRDGKISANASQPVSNGGYALVYDTNTLEGMSGGPVLNDKGEVIGIHGKGEKINDSNIEPEKINPKIAYIKSGRNAGIPINTFVKLSSRVGVNLGVSIPDTPITTATKVDDWLVQGLIKSEQEDYKGAIAAYNQAIRLNPNLSDAFINRGIVRAILHDKQAAIADFNEAIRLNPQETLAYINRGNVNRKLIKDLPAAIADYSQAIRINPKEAQAYTRRGSAQQESGDRQSALADFNKAIALDANNAEAYFSRGLLRYYKVDKQGGIADLKQAILLSPNNPIIYNQLGDILSNEGANKEAIAFYNQAIKIYPKFADAYYSRGIAHRQIGDKQAALADFRQAANIYQQQPGKQFFAQQARQRITDLQRTASATTPAKVTSYEGDILNTTHQQRGKVAIEIEEIDSSSRRVKVRVTAYQGLFGEGEFDGVINKDNVLKLSGTFGAQRNFFETDWRLEFLANDKIRGTYSLYTGDHDIQGRTQQGEFTVSKVKRTSKAN